MLTPGDEGARDARAWSPSRLRRPSPQAVIGVAFSLGFTLGPMLGASLPVQTAPWLALLFTISDLLFLFCFLPETLPPEKRVQWDPETTSGSWGWGLGSVGLQGAPHGCQSRVPGEAGLSSFGIQKPLGTQCLLGSLCSPDPPVSEAWQVTGGQATRVEQVWVMPSLGCWT